MKRFNRALIFCIALLSNVSLSSAGSSFCAKHSSLTSCLSGNSKATAFCSSFLKSTITDYQTLTPLSTTDTTQTTTATTTITIAATGTTTSTCSRTTLTPYTVTYTIPGEGTFTYTFTGPNVKKRAASTEARATASTPACFSGQPSASISAGCSCIGVTESYATTTVLTTAMTSTITSTVTKTVKTKTTATTSYSATSTVYDLHKNSTYKTNGTTYDVYNFYRFNFNAVDVTFYSCEYGLCELEPKGCPIPNCLNGLTDCLQICAKYVTNCTAVLYERDDINSNRTCAFIDTRTHPLSCGYKDDHDDFGVQRGFLN